MPRILFGVTVPITALVFLRGQLTELAQQDWDVHLATSPIEGFEDLTYVPEVTLHALPMKRPPAPLADAVSLLRWISLLRKVKPDVIVASTPKAGLLGMLAARFTRTPIRVYHLRGLRSEGLQGLPARLSWASERIAISCATSILCDSPSLLRKMRDLNLLSPKQGVVLGLGSCCGVDTDHFRPPSEAERRHARETLGLDPDTVAIGFIGRIVPDKGIPELLAALADVHANSPNLALVLVGPEESCDVHIPREAPWIHTVGSVQDVLPYLWALDILVLPSMREGFPVSLLEAQACELPVITTDATGCIDAVVDGVTGLVVPRRNVRALAAAIDYLDSNPDKREELGGNGRSWVVDHFHSESVRSNVIGHLTELAGA